MRADLYAHLTRLSFGYFDRVRTGQLLSRITSDLEPVGGFCTWGFRMIFRSVVLFLGVLAVCVWMNPRLALLSLSTMPLLTATAYFVGERIRPAFERAREQLGALTTVLQENLAGIRIVKLYVREPLERERFRAASAVLRDRNYEAQRIDAAYYPLTGFWAGLSGLLVLWIGGMEVLHGRLTLPEYVAFEAYLLLLLLPMRMLGYMVRMQRLRRSTGSPRSSTKSPTCATRRIRSVCRIEEPFASRKSLWLYPRRARPARRQLPRPPG